HLGQLLVAENDVMIIDFEGEPRRSLERRRGKSSPLRDVAGMLRSLDYAAAAALRAFGRDAAERNLASLRAGRWRDKASADLLRAYRKHMAGSVTYPENERFERGLLDLFTIQKAAYEVMYEVENRPDWLDIPLRGLFEILRGETA